MIKFMPQLRINKLELSYEIVGDGKKDILLIPPFGVRCDEKWLAFAKSMNPEYRVITFEMRGSGSTKYTGEPFTVDDLSNDVLGIIDKLELKKPHLCGVSMGAAIATTVASQNPEAIDKVILLSAFPKLSELSQKAYRAMRTLVNDGNTEEAMVVVAPLIFSATFLQRNGFINDWQELAKANQLNREGIVHQINAILDYDGWPILQKITSSCLILAGDEGLQGNRAELEKMQSSIQGSELQFLTTGHLGHIEAPDLVMQKLKTFLES